MNCPSFPTWPPPPRAPSFPQAWEEVEERGLMESEGLLVPPPTSLPQGHTANWEHIQASKPFHSLSHGPLQGTPKGHASPSSSDSPRDSPACVKKSSKKGLQLLCPCLWPTTSHWARPSLSSCRDGSPDSLTGLLRARTSPAAKDLLPAMTWSTTEQYCPLLAGTTTPPTSGLRLGAALLTKNFNITFHARTFNRKCCELNWGPCVFSTTEQWLFAWEGSMPAAPCLGNFRKSEIVFPTLKNRTGHNVECDMASPSAQGSIHAGRTLRTQRQGNLHPVALANAQNSVKPLPL